MLFFLLLLKELFVQHLALSSFNNGPGKETNTLSYSDLANTAEETETFHFLTGEAARVLTVCLRHRTVPRSSAVHYDIDKCFQCHYQIIHVNVLTIFYN